MPVGAIAVSVTGGNETPGAKAGTGTGPGAVVAGERMGLLLHNRRLHRAIRAISAAAIAAPAAAFAAPPSSDDFNTCSLLSSTWAVVDPIGDCDVSVVGAGTGIAQLQFVLPAGVEHDAWVTANDVLRVVQTVDNTNFTVEIKVDSPLTQAFQGVGIMALESPSRFIRCEMHRGPGGPQFFVASIVDGSAMVHHFGAGVSAAPYWLRLSRSGNTWTPSYSTNGADFTSPGSFARTLAVSQVGPFALNAGVTNSASTPAFTGLVDYFFNTASPIVDEDQGPAGDIENTLTVNIAGDGIVQKNPPGPSYACGEVVTLTAIPGPGGGFAGWTGAVVSQANPLQLTISADTTLLATFLSDTTPPDITCPPNFTTEAGNLPPPSFAGGSASDNFDTNLLITFADVVLPGAGCPQVSIIERTWTATDDAGNMASCVQTITVEDHTPPTLLGLPLNLNAECSNVPAPPVVTATDVGDPAPQVTLDEFVFPGDCDGRFTLQRTWTATDACGNTSQATRLVNVVDATPPTVTLQPAPATVQCGNIPSAQPPIVTDNCDLNPQVVLNETTSAGTCASGYTVTRTWIATDACGNVRYATQHINVVDALAPILTLPPDLTIGCNASILPSSTGFATAVDGDDPNPLVTFSDTPVPGGCPAGQSIQRQWSATDWAGNAAIGTQTITVADTTPPVITGIPAGEVLAECGKEPPPPTPSVTDDCDPAPQLSFSEQLQPGDCSKGFTILRTWTAIDACGNQASATQTLRFFDTTPPVITIPPDATVDCGPAQHGSPSSTAPIPGGAGTATATDNCDPDVAITHDDIVTPGPPGSSVVAYIKRTWTATDHCGNSVSAVQGVQLRDQTPPVIVQCPPDRSLSIEELTGELKRTAPLPDFRDELVAMDACSDEIVIQQTPAPGTMLPIGTHTIRFNVADGFRNKTTCKLLLQLVLHAEEDRCPDDPDKTLPGVCGCGVPDTDSDSDGVPDCNDGCPNDPAKTSPGACGCGAPETDSDGDGMPDCVDGCPNDPDKTDPGSCGCGALETDSDVDGTPDCVDGCPNDPDKTSPGECGCGTSDVDSDNDGVIDCLDGCPDDPEKTDPGACGCGVADADENKNGTPDCLEVCPTTGDCFTPHDSPGCVSSECCDTICDLDPYCCNVAWDEVCAAQALVACEARPGNECQNAFIISDGAFLHTLTDNSGATGDDTDAAGGDCAAVIDTIDEWFLYTAPVNGIATATTCSALTNFNTTLAVFASCDGAQLACGAADAVCDFGSTIQWPVQFGQSYLIRVSAVDDEIGEYELLVDTEADDVPSEVLDITFWYGQNQSFGHVGQPQRQVNLLGNVHSIHGVESLSYVLNGGPELPLSIGPDLRRLYHPGDFNVELFYEDLPAGPNQCVVTALDSNGNSIERALNFTVTHTAIWPLPHAIDWSTAPSIQSVAQVVDGKWQIEADGVRIIEQGYDRLIALGDITWTNYEVTVPITIHAIDPNGYLPPSHTPGFGLILRWEGHTDFLEPGSQPMTGYWPLGCAAEYVFHLDQCGYRLQLYGNPFVLRDQDNTCEQLAFNVTYLWKVRVETQGNGEHFYGFKVWEQGTPEPPDWELSMTEAVNQPDNGCLLLFSHHVDVTYGNVQVVPVP
jgi:hypothetical protein